MLSNVSLTFSANSLTISHICICKCFGNLHAIKSFYVTRNWYFQICLSECFTHLFFLVCNIQPDVLCLANFCYNTLHTICFKSSLFKLKRMQLALFMLDGFIKRFACETNLVWNSNKTNAPNRRFAIQNIVNKLN